ncbi:hypothetical protein ABIA40_000354 [Bradyrhizobium sp. USDA 223]
MSSTGWRKDPALLDREIAQDAIENSAVNRLMTITGVNLAVAAGVMAAIRDISRFNSPQKLVSYFGLNPRVRQSGLGAAHHGRISKIGRNHARAMLVEAAWAAAKAPGPLHAFFLRIRARRGYPVAGGGRGSQAHGVLLAFADEGRGLPVGAPGAGRQQDPRDSTSSRASATIRSRRGRPAYAYNIKALRHREMFFAAQAEQSYERIVSQWKRPAKNRRAGASARQKDSQSGDACSRRITLRHEVARAPQP